MAFRYVPKRHGVNFVNKIYFCPFPLQLTTNKPRRNSLVGTSIWMAPEVIQRKPYTTAVDIWSFGVTVIEMAETKPCMFSVPSVRAMALIGTRVTPHFANPREHSEVLCQFIERMLVRNAAKRATAKSLLNHKFLQRANN